MESSGYTIYTLAGRATALRVQIVNGPNTLYTLPSDHLGSSRLMSDSNGITVPGSPTRYYPFGDWRTEPTANLTDRGYTGHQHNNTTSNDLGLIYMNARYYLPGIARFISADTLIPDPQNPQAFNRYTYTLNNPLRFNDPSGHISCEELGTEECNEDGSFVDAPLPPSQLVSTWNGKPPLPEGGNGVDVTMWLYMNMIGNANSMEVQNLKHLWNGAGLMHPMESIGWKSMALLGFKDLVDYGEVWDFKKDFWENEIQTVTLAGHQFNMDIVANIHYGYVGTEIGFSDTLLYFAAGVAQQWKGDADGGQWWSYGDAPQDSVAITLGISLHNSYSNDMTYEEFVYTLNLWIDNGWLDSNMAQTGG